MTERPSISVNGRQRPLGVGVLDELLRELGYDPQGQGVAVAVNGMVVPRRRWQGTSLCQGDQVEIVKPFTGG